MKTIDKRIFKALEENNNNKFNNLIEGFITIAIGTIVLNEVIKKL